MRTHLAFGKAIVAALALATASLALGTGPARKTLRL